jgi:hypothetical protein
MHIIINKFIPENLLFENKKNKLVIKYKLNDIILLGIPLNIKYNLIIHFNNITYVYIDDIKTLDTLLTIQNHINSNINMINNLVKYNIKKKKYYIICKNRNNRNIIKNLYISIAKIYNNNYYNYIL